MEDALIDLTNTLRDFEKKLSALSPDIFAAKPLPDKWSKKEVIGHLIDSAQNNLRRFIVGQYEVNPKITYDQNFWVKANGYQDSPKEHVIQSWLRVNQQILSVLSNLPKENRGRYCDTGKEAVNLRTIEWLAVDYVKHLKHHLNQVFPGSFDITYP